MSLSSYFSNLNLTASQEAALGELNKFLFNNNNVFILKGYAGTGKTTMLEGIAKYLLTIGRFGHIMAPTGRAAKIIHDKTGYPATTIHRSIYNLDELKTYEAKDANGNETYKYFFGLKEHANQANKVFIFDEASMIGNSYSEDEFFRFGSGYLLNDILEYFDLNSNKNTKLIFVGDPAQLPPVNDSISRALDKVYFKQNGYECSFAELKDVVRQSSKSGILENAKYYRELIFSEKVSENIFSTEFHDIGQISIEQIADKYTEIEEVPGISKCIIIVFKNETAYTYNQIIRSRYFPGARNIMPGDILQVVKNNYSNKIQEFLNGEFVKVLEVGNETETQSAPIKQKGEKDKIVTLAFRNVKLQHPSGNIINIKLLETLLNGKYRDLTSNEIKALYISFIIRYEKKTGRKANRRAEEFKEAFKKDEYVNALQVKYGYAITGHKSQGGEWNTVFVDFSGRVGINKEVLRWSYTAITRASEKLFVLYPPKVEGIDFSNKKTAIGKVVKLPAGAIAYPEVEATPYHSLTTHPAKRLKFFEIEKKMNRAGYIIEKVDSKPFYETYYINNGTRTYQISFYHKSDGIISYYAANMVDDDSAKLIELFKQKVPWPYFYHYNGGNPLVQKLYNRVLSAMQELGIDLIGIDDTKMQNYYIAFYFRTTADAAYIQFYFNKNEQVKSLIAKSLLGEEDTELKKLLENLNHQ